MKIEKIDNARKKCEKRLLKLGRTGKLAKVTARRLARLRRNHPEKAGNRPAK
jgi:hypothetical protein